MSGVVTGVIGTIRSALVVLVFLLGGVLASSCHQGCSSVNSQGVATGAG